LCDKPVNNKKPFPEIRNQGEIIVPKALAGVKKAIFPAQIPKLRQAHNSCRPASIYYGAFLFPKKLALLFLTAWELIRSEIIHPGFQKTEFPENIF